MNVHPDTGVRLPIIATGIYLALLILIMGFGDFGSPRRLDRHPSMDPVRVITGKDSGFGTLVLSSPRPDSPLLVLTQTDEGSVLQLIDEDDGGILGEPVGSSTAHLTSCAWIADLDRDGMLDIAVGVRGRRGAVRILSGRTGKLIRLLTGMRRGERFGAAICSLSDLDDDGTPDLAIGAPAGDALATPAVVYLISGANGRIIRTMRPTNRGGSRFGESLAMIEDVDGDGKADLAVGAPGASNNGYRNGAVLVCSTAKGQILRRHDGSQDYQRFGSTVLSLNDVDRDGRRDYAVGTAGRRAAGLIRIYSGRTGEFVAGRRSDDFDDGFGSVLAEAGDINGDGNGDLAVAAPQARIDGIHGIGSVYLISGADGAILRRLNGTDEDEAFGTSIAHLRSTEASRTGVLLVSSPMSVGRPGRLSLFTTLPRDETR